MHADAKALSLASGRLGRVERVGKFTAANLEHFAAWNHFPLPSCALFWLQIKAFDKIERV